MPHTAAEVLATMTLREKAYQLLIVFPKDLMGVDPVTKAGDATCRALEQMPVGGLLYDRSNMVSRDQLRTMVENSQSYSKIPLIITCDEEGGRVARLMRTVGTPKLNAMLSYRDQGTGRAAENARILAGGLTSCAFNMDLAPVADVWSNPDNTVIGDRAYSTDYQEAADLVAAAVRGFHDGGAACTLKHFPGHGDTSEDSHYGSAYVRKSLDQLRAGELLPFAAGIRAGADAVMLGHLIVEDIDSEPAPFSRAIVTDLLRRELGFQGVVMTDSLQMQAMTDHYGLREMTVKAVQAGVDVLLCPSDPAAAADALVDAVESGTISQSRLDESVLRVLRMKENRGIL